MTSQRRRRPERRATPAVEPQRSQSFVERLNDFLSRVHTTPSWIAASTVAAASFTFAVSFVDSYAEREAHFDQDTLKFHRAHADGDNVVHVLKELANAYASAEALGRNYQATFVGKSVGDPLDRKQLDEGQSLVDDARSEIGVAIAAVSSVNFPDKDLNSAITAMNGDLVAQQKIVETFAMLYAAAERSDNSAIHDALVQVRANNDQTKAVDETFQIHWGRLKAEGDRFQAETRIAIQEATGEIKLYYFRKNWLMPLSLLYLASFGAVALWAFVKRWKSK